MNCSISPYIYIIIAVNFGDRPSGTIATVALYKTAQMGKERFPTASETVLESIYVDDIIDSIPDIKSARTLTKDITEMLKRGNFHMKEWIISGKCYAGNSDTNESVDVHWSPSNSGTNVTVDVYWSPSNSERVLGMTWLVEDDLFYFKVNDRIIEIFPPKNPDTLKLSKRTIMSFIRGLFDPPGLN